MKYLTNRDKFLSELKNIQINEKFDMSGSGPMGNDINWGDSLVGRLINSIRRKVGVGASLVRINSCIKALRNHFDEIIDTSIVNQISEEEKKKIGAIFVYEMVRIIEIAIYDKKQVGFTGDSEDGEITSIKDEDYIKEIESITIDVIEQVGSISDDYDLESGDNIVRYLNELLEKLRQMKKDLDDSKKESESQEESESEEEGSEELEKIKSNNQEVEKKANLVFFENFKTVANLYMTYKNMKDSQSKEKSNQKSEQEKEVNLSDRQMNFTKDDTAALKRKLNKPEYSKYKEQIEKKIKEREKNESLFILENKNNPVFSSLKSLYNVINSDGGEESLKDMKNVLQMSSVESVQLNTMNRLYKNIRRQFGVVDKTNEKLEILLGKESLANAIVNLYKVSKVANLEELVNFKDGILKFNQTMEKCLSPDLFKQEVKENKKVLSYLSFVSINENENIQNVQDENVKLDKKPKESDNKEPKESNKEKITLENQQDILKIYWDELRKKGLGKYILTFKQVEKLKIEIDKIDYPEEGADSIIMKGGSIGIDPIIEIVKIFNRAYKLHTVTVIPGGRSGGKVSNQTFREYTSFGDGKPESAGASGGPYRNNKVFNTWENGVLDIMKDRKYQPIFNKETVILVGRNRKSGVGTALNRFMNDMLDGDTLYQSGSRGGYSSDKTGGAQKQFLLKYFGDIDPELKDKIKDLDSKDLSVTGSNDAKENTKVADGIPNITLGFKDFKISEGIEGRIFLCKGKEDDKDVMLYINTIKSGSGFINVVYSKSFKEFKELIKRNYDKNNIDDGKIPRIVSSSSSPTLFASKFGNNVLIELNKGKEIEIKGNEKGLVNDPKNNIKFKPEPGSLKCITISDSEFLQIKKYPDNYPPITDNTEKTV
jgi:hypothetical protein